MYPPSTSANVKYFAGFPLDFETDSTDMKPLDIQERHGKCMGRMLSSDQYASRQFGVKFEIDNELVMKRFGTVAIGIAAFVMGAWLLRLIL